MELRANYKFIDTSAIAHLLTNGEKNIDIITIVVDRIYNDIDLSECNFILRAVNSNLNLIDQTLQKTIEESSIKLLWTVNEFFTSCDGELKLEIRGVKEDTLVMKYSMPSIYIKSSAAGQGLPELNVIEQALNDMQNILANAENIAVKTPYISDGTWWVWDIKGSAYVDTKVTAYGIDGINGTNGQNGIDGGDGLSAYELAVQQGYSGTLSEWLASLKGEKGTDGVNGIDGINGTNGQNGIDGGDGLSAYELAVQHGYLGTLSGWLASLKGEKGADGVNGIDGINGTNGQNGADGGDGLSAYELAVQQGYSGTLSEWLTSLEGEKGADGTSITIDNTLSATSENAVQNKIVTLALGEKAKASDLSSHTSDATVHITAAERASWNAKQSALSAGTSTTAGTTKLYPSTGTNTDGTMTQSAINTALNTKSAKSIITNVTLVSSTWAGSSVPYAYTLSVTGATASNVVEVVPNYDTITDAQLTTLKSAQIDKITQTTGSITLYAYGTKPTVDMPIKTIVRGDI